ncbi:MAG TPA: hypothetical protein VMV00_00465 [Candidatus Baltobacteraceae bacterium]|nr:hypothetical protein [Candidatus Baltobacteraceae bacterium]
MGKVITEMEKKDYFRETLSAPETCMKNAAVAAERFIKGGQPHEALDSLARARAKAKECGDISRAHLQRESKTESEYRMLEAQYTRMMTELRFKMTESVSNSTAIVPAHVQSPIATSLVPMRKTPITIRKAETA